MTQAPLVLEGVARPFGARGLAPASLTLFAGTATLVTGANGAGKTTLLRLAAGLLTPSVGQRRCIGTAVYLAGGQGGRNAQRVEAAVCSAGTIAGRSASEARALAVPALADVGLAEHAHRRVGSLSSGERARLTLAVSLVVPAAVLCLDEPSANLDDRGARVVASVVDRLRDRGVAVLVATHDVERLAWCPDARLLVADGRVTAVPFTDPLSSEAAQPAGVRA